MNPCLNCTFMVFRPSAPFDVFICRAYGELGTRLEETKVSNQFGPIRTVRSRKPITATECRRRTCWRCGLLVVDGACPLCGAASSDGLDQPEGIELLYPCSCGSKTAKLMPRQEEVVRVCKCLGCGLDRFQSNLPTAEIWMIRQASVVVDPKLYIRYNQVPTVCKSCGANAVVVRSSMRSDSKYYMECSACNVAVEGSYDAVEASRRLHDFAGPRTEPPLRYPMVVTNREIRIVGEPFKFFEARYIRPGSYETYVKAPVEQAPVVPVVVKPERLTPPIVSPVRIDVLPERVETCVTPTVPCIIDPEED